MRFSSYECAVPPHTAAGLTIGAGARNEKEALAFGPMVSIPFALFGGLFLNSDSTPKYFYWLAYISPFRVRCGATRPVTSLLTFLCFSMRSMERCRTK